MAEKKVQADNIEREYTIPLRREWNKVPRYKRANKAVKAVKEFLAKHFRIPDRDLRKVKLDKLLNEQLWFRGIKKPLAKVKVKARKDGEFVRAELAELPDKLKFKKAREEKQSKEATEAAEKAKKKVEENKGEEKPGGKTDEQKLEETEKKAAVAEEGDKIEKEAAKKMKHQTKQNKQPKHQQRVALKK